ncbi:hypothetical protein P3T76_010568 [Phytophthora citrophthora]|uniref:Uncharacterized protein n=1 Tax=Phytophthora citrophthora TaxID=4793 RepID=A0AAD9GBD5_9STRA|nr:hypothetical protein P3T76_010568 [Phytophthora citrophthora]
MEVRRPVGEVIYLAGGGFYVQACPPSVTCPPTQGENGPSSTALLNAMNAIDSDDDDDEDMLEEEAKTDYPVVTRSSRISGAAMDLFSRLTDSESDTESEESSSEEEEEEEEEDTESDEDSDSDSSHKRLVRRSAPRPSSTLAFDYDQMIRSNMEEIEAKKPWRFAFRCLKVPFNFKREEDPFDVFFLRWDEFWRVNGRAVWERSFWQPLLPGSTEYYRRKWRQTRAQRAFQELATDLVDRLKEKYTQFLTNTPHEGWWYRIEPFPLRKLFLKDRNLYGQYLELMVKKRWPRGRKFLVKRGLKPMWWLPDLTATSDGL